MLPSLAHLESIFLNSYYTLILHLSRGYLGICKILGYFEIIVFHRRGGLGGERDSARALGPVPVAFALEGGGTRGGFFWCVCVCVSLGVGGVRTGGVGGRLGSRLEGG